MRTPFENDSFAQVAQLFEDMFPGHKYRAFWCPDEHYNEDGELVRGNIDIAEDGAYEVVVCSLQSVGEALDSFMWALAHVAVGLNAEDAEKRIGVYQDIVNAYEEAYQ